MKRLFFVILLFVSLMQTWACTSMLVAASHSATGRPLMWKHRDTGAPGNFLAKVGATDSTYAYIALFNDGDSLLTEAWIGYNEAGFAIMNTASYNLKPYCVNKDGEGILMSMALARCTTVAEFEKMLEDMYSQGPCQIGLMANFGVMDASGAIAYIEADDYSAKRYDVEDYMIRTNFSQSVPAAGGKGFERYADATHLLEESAKNGDISPLSFVSYASRSFWHSPSGKDLIEDGQQWMPIDNNCIPRGISTASIVIDGAAADGSTEPMLMWAALGYPPCAKMSMATLQCIPEALGPNLPGWESAACNAANALRDECTTVDSKGRKKINLQTLRKIIARERIADQQFYEMMKPRNTEKD